MADTAPGPGITSQRQRKRPWMTCFRALISLATLCATGWVNAMTLSDDRGVTVSFDRAPQRIVSLLPSLTEIVCELDQCHRLVGVDRNSNYPASVQRLPRVGGGLDPSIEAIVALRPDVVLMATSSKVGERLQALGLKVVTLEPKLTPMCSVFCSSWGNCWRCPTHKRSGARSMPGSRLPHSLCLLRRA